MGKRVYLYKQETYIEDSSSTIVTLKVYSALNKEINY